jgi:hypothetical protein
VFVDKSKWHLSSFIYARISFQHEHDSRGGTAVFFSEAAHPKRLVIFFDLTIANDTGVLDRSEYLPSHQVASLRCNIMTPDSEASCSVKVRQYGGAKTDLIYDEAYKEWQGDPSKPLVEPPLGDEVQDLDCCLVCVGNASLGRVTGALSLPTRKKKKKLRL